MVLGVIGVGSGSFVTCGVAATALPFEQIITKIGIPFQ